MDNLTWGMNRVPLPRDVAPDENVVFSFTVIAPMINDLTNFQWRMVDDVMPNQGWFGDTSENRIITVGKVQFLNGTPASIVNHSITPLIRM